MDSSSIKDVKISHQNKVSRKEAEKAVETLIRWAGDDPNREGLRETPKRVINAYEEFFSGYKESADKYLSKTFEDVQGYKDMVLLKDIPFNSHCEHHMVPIVGIAHIAYIPVKRVVGISKLARTVEIFAKRLQTQETMTQQISTAIEKSMKPRGVAVYIKAVHQCMTTRGVEKPNVSTITNSFLGEFEKDLDLQKRFLSYIME
ncbi:MAG: GTP cyclohydrolase I FolE [Pelagibacteraceae bacterium TMED65]|nr:GTP cyclohydrolase I FolE [Rickettsiales bacterium]OUU51606.1 MAG: GTP cyclohydrolase I FolE [Pelagibacteraceae bacterium TMED65]